MRYGAPTIIVKFLGLQDKVYDGARQITALIICHEWEGELLIKNVGTQKGGSGPPGPPSGSAPEYPKTWSPSQLSGFKHGGIMQAYKKPIYN